MNNVDTKYIGGKEASEILGVHQRTLYVWEETKKIDTIRTPGGKRLCNVEKYMKDQGLIIKNLQKSKIKTTKIEELDDVDSEDRLKICYARVLSVNYNDDLEKQKSLLKELYPDHILIEDIGSGINLTKKGILKIIDLAIQGNIEELVIINKDRLAKIGYDLIEHIIKKFSDGKITIINDKDEIEPEEETSHDILRVMDVFVDKINLRRKYKNNKIKQ
jgi:putative resolvase